MTHSESLEHEERMRLIIMQQEYYRFAIKMAINGMCYMEITYKKVFADLVIIQMRQYLIGIIIFIKIKTKRNDTKYR